LLGQRCTLHLKVCHRVHGVIALRLEDGDCLLQGGKIGLLGERWRGDQKRENDCADHGQPIRQLVPSHVTGTFVVPPPATTAPMPAVNDGALLSLTKCLAPLRPALHAGSEVTVTTPVCT